MIYLYSFAVARREYFTLKFEINFSRYSKVDPRIKNNECLYLLMHCRIYIRNSHLHCFFLNRWRILRNNLHTVRNAITKFRFMQIPQNVATTFFHNACTRLKSCQKINI